MMVSYAKGSNIQVYKIAIFGKITLVKYCANYYYYNTKDTSIFSNDISIIIEI